MLFFACRLESEKSDTASLWKLCHSSWSAVITPPSLGCTLLGDSRQQTSKRPFSHTFTPQTHQRCETRCSLSRTASVIPYPQISASQGISHVACATGDRYYNSRETPSLTLSFRERNVHGPMWASVRRSALEYITL